MNSVQDFTVVNPPAIFRLCSWVLCFFAILVFLNTVFSPPPHTAMYVCITIFVFIPGILLALWTRAFCIRVSGTKVSVRKCLGFVSFCLEASDIKKIEWKIIETKFGQNENIRVFTSTGKTFSIETLMVNSDLMKKFIEENVDEAKIKRTYITSKQHFMF